QFWMEQSFNGGATWTKVAEFPNSTNWYNNTDDEVWEGNSGGWISVENALSNIAGQSNVKYRFVFESNGSTEQEGFAIDNFKIEDPIEYDVKLVEIQSPDNSRECGFTDNQNLIVMLYNQGQRPITQGSVKY